MKDKCAKFKKTGLWKVQYVPRIKAIEKNLDAEGKKLWKKLNTCSKIQLVDKFQHEGKFSYVIPK
jgi:hypothetical protein